MTDACYDQNYWEELWSKTLREHADQVAHRPPNAHLTAEVASLRPGLALDPGCGHGSDIAARIEWIEGDLATWTPESKRYDLVTCLYVHVAGSVEEMVRRMASGVAPGGTMFLVGHQPIDPATGATTAAAGQVQVSVDSATAALDSRDWELAVAEDRRRAAAGSGVDAVIRARRLT